MSVEFKSPVTSANVNQAFLDKNKDTETLFKLALKRAGSGADVLDVQQAINDLIGLIDLHIADYSAHREFDTKANLDTWATTANNGDFAFATDEKKSYQVIDGVLAEIGGGGGGLNQWESAASYVIGDVIWLLADYKIYVCIADNSDATFTPTNWQELSSNFLEGYVSVTPNDNILITDSLGTNLFRKDFNELYIEDFKENLPSAVLTASNVAITVNDVADATYLSNTIATFTQSGASTTQYVETAPIVITNSNKWLLEPIKIQSVQGISGGAGTWDFRVFTSTDGVSYTDKQVAVQLGDLKNDKIITQLDNDTTHVKLRWTIVNPNNATTLTLGGFIITSEAFSVGQTIVKNSIFLEGNGNEAITANTENVVFNGSGNGWNSTNYEYTIQYSDSELRLAFAVTTSSVAMGVLLYVDRGAGYVLHKRLASPPSATTLFFGSYTSVAGEFEKGDKIAIRFSQPVTLSNNTDRHYLNIVEEAYADNVIVDAATSGLNTRNAGALTISATTTAPTKGTVVTDKVWVVYNANDTATIRFEYQQSTAGTAGSGDYLFKMPSGLEIDTTKITPYATVEGSGGSLIPSTVGAFSASYSVDTGVGSVVVYDKDFVRFVGTHETGEGYVGSGYFGLNLAGSYSAIFTVPIKGRSIDSLPVLLDLSNERQNSLSLSGNDGRAITANTESIPFGTGTAGTTYKGWTYGADGSTGLTGNYYTVQKSGSIVTLSGAVLYAAGATRNVDLYKNNVLYKRIAGDTISTASIVLFYYESMEGEFSEGDKLSIHGYAGTLSNNAPYHYLSIVEEYAPKGFAANAVSITNHVTGGVEYLTGDTENGKPVYAVEKIVETTITTTNSTYLFVGLGLTPRFPFVRYNAGYAYFPLSFSTIDYNAYFYDPATGYIQVLIAGGRNLIAGSTIRMEYTKP